MYQIETTTQSRISSLNLKQKINLSLSIIDYAYSRIPSEQTALAWTGGKDSTLLLWLLRQYCTQHALSLPKIVFIDEGDTFTEVWNFAEQLAQKWHFTYVITRNDDVLKQVNKVGQTVITKKLNTVNQEALQKLGVKDSSFPFEPESLVGNHLMKTVACNQWLTDNNMLGMYVGVRWDEQHDRSKDHYLRKISDPIHVRLEPILHFTEQDVWDTIHLHTIPSVSLYANGYRSLGAKSTTRKIADIPAWEQDLSSNAERSGRHQDKEKIMKRLRDLGYM